MKIRRRVFVGMVTMWGLVLTLMLAGCAHPKGSFEVYGMGAVEVDAPYPVVVEARQAVVHKFQHYVKDAQGRNYDPTFHESASSWKGTLPGGSRTNEVCRSKTEFEDAAGLKMSIEEISITGRPILVFLSHETQFFQEAMCNEFLASLQKQGVRMRR